MSSAPPASSTTDTATWATTRARWSRCLRRVELFCRPADASQAAKVPSRGSTATKESKSASASARPSAKPSTGPSSRISPARGE